MRAICKKARRIQNLRYWARRAGLQAHRMRCAMFVMKITAHHAPTRMNLQIRLWASYVSINPLVGRHHDAIIPGRIRIVVPYGSLIDAGLKMGLNTRVLSATPIIIFCHFTGLAVGAEENQHHIG